MSEIPPHLRGGAAGRLRCGSWCVRVTLVEFFHQVRCMEILGRDPRIFRCGEAFPVHEEAELPSSAVKVCFADRVDFPFGFTLNHFWIRPRVIMSMGVCFDISCEQIHMESGVDPHGRREAQSISDRGQFLCDGEWAITPGCEFHRGVM